MSSKYLHVVRAVKVLPTHTESFASLAAYQEEYPNELPVAWGVYRGESDGTQTHIEDFVSEMDAQSWAAFLDMP